MNFSLDTIDITDAARMLEDLAVIMQESAARGEVAPELYASAFELLGGVATAIREKAGCAA